MMNSMWRNTLKCGLCFGRSDLNPLLECHHALCGSCTSSLRRGGFVWCPQCKEKYLVPECFIVEWTESEGLKRRIYSEKDNRQLMETIYAQPQAATGRSLTQKQRKKGVIGAVVVADMGQLKGVPVVDIADCPVCFDEFVNPKLLPCSHTLCLSCLENLEGLDWSKKSIKCPMCNTKHNVPKRGVKAFVENATMIQLIAERKEMKAMKGKLKIQE